MIKLVVYIAMFILVLFVALPIIAIGLLAMRDKNYHHIDRDMRHAKKQVPGRS